MKAAHRLVGWLGDHFRRQFIFFLVLTLFLIVINEVSGFGTEITKWDFLYITTVITFVVALRLAVDIPYKVHETLTRLANRGTLYLSPDKDLSPDKLTEFWQKLKAMADRWAILVGLFIAALTLLGFYFVFRFERQILFTLTATLAGFIAGLFLGRAMAYGRMSPLLKEATIMLRVQPGHLDGAGGLKPVGDVFFYQAMVIGLAAAFLAIWWLIIPLFPGYLGWRNVYLVFLAVVILIEMLAFFVPMWSFHVDMRAQKAQKMGKVDGWMKEVGKLQSELMDASANADMKAQQERLTLLIDHYRAVDQMPTWPVDAGIRRKFTVGNLALFLPLLSYFIQLQTPDKQSVWSVLGDIIKGLSQGQ